MRPAALRMVVRPLWVLRAGEYRQALTNNKARLACWQGGLFLRACCEAACEDMSGVLVRGGVGILCRHKIDCRGFGGR